MAMIIPMRLRFPGLVTSAFQPMRSLAVQRRVSKLSFAKREKGVLTFPIHLNSSLYLLELVKDERIALVAVCVIVG